MRTPEGPRPEPPELLVSKWNHDHDTGILVAWNDKQGWYRQAFTMGPAYISPRSGRAVLDLAGHEAPIFVERVRVISAGADGDCDD